MKLSVKRLIFAAILLPWTPPGFEALAMQPGEAAPALVLGRLGDGKDVRLSDFKGQVVYVDFWASWCAPCRKSLPLYEELYTRLSADGFQLLAVNLDEDPRDARSFIDRHPVSYPVLFDPSGVSARDWKVPAMPSSYLLDPDGVIAHVYAGFEASHIGRIEHDIKTLLDRIPDNRADGTDSLR